MTRAGCFGFIIAIWLLLLLGGAAWKGGLRPTPSTWQAARDLPAGHQLQPGDLARPSFPWPAALPPATTLMGRYLPQPVKAGAPLEAENLSARPTSIWVPPGHAVFLYPLTGEQCLLTGALRAGNEVYLAPRVSQPGVAPVQVRKGRTTPPKAAAPSGVAGPLLICAVHHATTEAPGDWLLLAIPAAKRAKVETLLSRKNLLLLAGVPRPRKAEPGVPPMGRSPASR